MTTTKRYGLWIFVGCLVVAFIAIAAGTFPVFVVGLLEAAVVLFIAERSPNG